MIKNRRYTKSRLHEKVNAISKIGCVVIGFTLASTVIMNVLAKDKSENLAVAGPTIKYNSEVFCSNTEEVVGTQYKIEIKTLRKEEEITYIRCTTYCDTGYTASGAWTTEGCLAGKREWLGKTCKLYRVTKSGEKGECIGTFTFKDTGFGLEELNGISYPDGTIKHGASIDMWHPTEDECWDWIAEYGDYVYMEFIQ